MDNVIDITDKMDSTRLRNELIGLYMNDAEYEEFCDWNNEVNGYFESEKGTLIIWNDTTFLNCGDDVWMINGEMWDNDVAQWFEALWN